LFTSSHGLYLLTSERAKANYFRIEVFVLSFIFIIHAAFIIVWSVVAPWNMWLYLTQYTLALTQVIFSLLAVIAVIILKIFMSFHKLSAKDNGRRFLQVLSLLFDFVFFFD
jgi:hypothetical protein